VKFCPAVALNDATIVWPAAVVDTVTGAPPTVAVAVTSLLTTCKVADPIAA
jgi:hypothetical protein